MSKPLLENANPNLSKLGLALSGGGFRASFFHIGVLAHLAEIGLLRHVEVISTVSGGSIIGALYYLHLKNLLETKLDSEISNKDYLDILQKIEVDFLKAVQKNVIMTAYNNPFKTIRMASSNYNSSLRLAELYEEYFYRPILKSKEPIKMSDLKIIPKGENSNFYPLKDNPSRQAKVPILLINAALLNTGRNWYFEATHMGEHPRDSEDWQAVDKNARLLRPENYQILKNEHKNFLLSHAVAASAALPGVFAPIKIDKLYPEDIQLQLVDAGVHDNQGIAGLLTFGCTDFIISDACRPLEFESRPDLRTDGLLLRVRSMLGDRLREEQLLRMLTGKYKDHTAFIHLRKNFPITSKNHLSDSNNSSLNPKLPTTKLDSDKTGIDPKAQQLLARVRTHLDSFTDLEANSLMYYGYKLGEQTFDETAFEQVFIKEQTNKINWNFLKIAPLMQQPTEDFLFQLKVATERFLKVFRLNTQVRTISLVAFFLIFLLILLSIFSILSIIWNIAQVQEILNIPLNEAILTISPILVILFVLRIIFAKHYSRLRQNWFSFWAKALLPAICFPLVWLHLLVYDRLFLQIGELNKSNDNFLQPDPALNELADQKK
ncbi:MAG: patatin-like phospholipase family protein [Blastocatellia bacterium]